MQVAVSLNEFVGVARERCIGPLEALQATANSSSVLRHVVTSSDFRQRELGPKERAGGSFLQRAAMLALQALYLLRQFRLSVCLSVCLSVHPSIRLSV